MKISTSRFGKIEVSKEEIITFHEGLLGFEQYHKYIVLNTDEGSPFSWLQCVDDGNLAFVIVEPLSFMFEYDLEISDADANFISLKKAEDAVLYVIVSIPGNPSDMTANLQGPIVVNASNRMARQVISNNPKHSVKVRILDEMEKRTAKINEMQKSSDSRKRGGKE